MVSRHRDFAIPIFDGILNAKIHPSIFLNAINETRTLKSVLVSCADAYFRHSTGHTDIHKRKDRKSQTGFLVGYGRRILTVSNLFTHLLIPDVMELDDTICFCFHVPKRKILNHLRIHKPRRASQLTECGGAGTGCGWCVAYLKKYFKDFEAGNESPDSDVQAAEYSQGRVKYLEDKQATPPNSP